MCDSEARQPDTDERKTTYKAGMTEVLRSLGVHRPGNAKVTWNLNGDTLEVTVVKVEGR